jgi:hypothetical protein
MSDEAAVQETAVVEAPAEQPVEAVGQETPQPAETAKSLLDGLRHGLHHSQLQPRTEKGEFSGPPSAAPVTPEATEEAVATETKPAPETAPFVMVPLSANDPLRAQGITEIKADPEHERAIRALVNRPSHRAELERTQSRLGETLRAAAAAKAELRALQDWRDRVLTDPSILSQVNELREAGYPDLADQAARGLKAMQTEEATKYRDEEIGQVEAFEAAERGQSFIDAFKAEIQQSFASVSHFWQPPIDDVLEEYAMHIRSNRAQPLDINYARRLMAARFQNDPAVIARATADIQKRNEATEAERRAALEAELRSKIEADLRKQAEEAAARRNGNPAGRLATAGVAGNAAASGSDGETAHDFFKGITRRG